MQFVVVVNTHHTVKEVDSVSYLAIVTFNLLHLFTVCRGGAETYAELHPLHESEKTQSSGSYATEARQGPDTRGKCHMSFKCSQTCTRC